MTGNNCRFPSSGDEVLKLSDAVNGEENTLWESEVMEIYLVPSLSIQ